MILFVCWLALIRSFVRWNGSVCCFFRNSLSQKTVRIRPSIFYRKSSKRFYFNNFIVMILPSNTFFLSVSFAKFAATNEKCVKLYIDLHHNFLVRHLLNVNYFCSFCYLRKKNSPVSLFLHRQMYTSHNLMRFWQYLMQHTVFILLHAIVMYFIFICLTRFFALLVWFCFRFIFIGHRAVYFFSSFLVHCHSIATNWRRCFT